MTKISEYKNAWKKRIILIGLATLAAASLTSCGKKENTYSIEQEEEIDSIEVYTYAYKSSNLELFRYKYNGVYHTEIFMYCGKEVETGLDYFKSVRNPQHIVRANKIDLIEFEMNTGDIVYKTSDVMWGKSYKYINKKETTYYNLEEICEIEKNIKDEEKEVYDTVQKLREQYCINYEPKEIYPKIVNDELSIWDFSYIHNGYVYWRVAERKFELNGKEYFIGITNPNIIVIMDESYDCTAFIIEDEKLIEVHGVNWYAGLDIAFKSEMSYEEIVDYELASPPQEIEDKTTRNLKIK